jgi:membrane-bound inhibitor of C-type lysozyme
MLMKLSRFAFLISIVCVGCQSSGQSIDPDNVSQPRSARFLCADGQSISVENLGSKVNVTTAEGAIVELPSLPAGSRSRYSEGQTALVLNGRDALFMSTGKAPLECKR